MKTSHAVLGIAAGCGCLSMIAVGIGVFAFYDFVNVPAGAGIEVEAPLRVPVGEPFEIVVTATNASGSRMTLVDVDIANAYLGGIAIESSSPPFSDSMAVPLDETVSYSIDLPIPAGGETTVVFQAVALRAGDYGGEIDVCINGMGSCLSQVVRTVVSP